MAVLGEPLPPIRNRLRNASATSRQQHEHMNDMNDMNDISPAGQTGLRNWNDRCAVAR
jgi:hypothetical protein